MIGGRVRGGFTMEAWYFSGKGFLGWLGVGGGEVWWWLGGWWGIV